MGSLPTRSTLRGGAAPAAKPTPPPEPAHAPANDNAEAKASLPVPGGGEQAEAKSIWDGTMGPFGIFLTAAIACGLGYLAFRIFN